MGLTPKHLIFVLVSLTFSLNVSVTNSQNVPNTNIGTGQQQQQYNYQAQPVQPVQQQQPLYTSTNDQLTGASAPMHSHISIPHSSSYDAIAKHAESHQHHSQSHYGGGAVDNGWKEPQTMAESLAPYLFLPALLLALMYLIWAGSYSSHFFHNQYDGPDEWHTTNPGKEHHGHHGHKPHHGHGGHHERSLNDLTSTVLKSIEKPLS